MLLNKILKVLKKYRFQLVLFIFGLFFSILTVDVYLRITEDKSSDGGQCSSLDKYFHNVMIPNTVCRQISDEWDVEFSINNLGIRDEDLSFYKPDDEYRLVLLGDSFTQGHGVELEDRYSTIIEKRFNENNPNVNINIINLAIFGHSPLTQYLYLKKVGLLFNPDLMMYAFTITDFFDDNKRFEELIFSYPDLGGDAILVKIESGQVEFDFEKINKSAAIEKNQEIEKSKTVYLIKKWLRENIRIYKFTINFIKNTVRDEKENQSLTGDIDHDIYSIIRGDDISEDDWQKLWKIPITNLVNMKKLLEEKNIPFVVIAIPDAIQVSSKEWPGRTLISVDENFSDTREPFEYELTERLNSHDIPTINLLPGFKQSGKFPLYFSQDYHWNKTGHELAAEIIYNYLLNAGYFKLKTSE